MTSLSAFRTASMIGRFEDPAPQNITRRDSLLRTGNVRVILDDGGLGESSIGATKRVCSFKSGWLGKREHDVHQGRSQERHNPAFHHTFQSGA